MKTHSASVFMQTEQSLGDCHRNGADTRRHFRFDWESSASSRRAASKMNHEQQLILLHALELAHGINEMRTLQELFGAERTRVTLRDAFLG